VARKMVGRSPRIMRAKWDVFGKVSIENRKKIKFKNKKINVTAMIKSKL
jgi:hypothetical protein